MIIKNISTRAQRLDLISTLNDSECSLDLAGNSSVDLGNKYKPVDLDTKLFIILEDDTKTANTVEVREERTTEVEVQEESKEEVNNEENSDEALSVESSEESFICDECGADFASARGLARHKSMTHSSDN